MFFTIDLCLSMQQPPKFDTGSKTCK